MLRKYCAGAVVAVGRSQVDKWEEGSTIAYNPSGTGSIIPFNEEL